MANSFLHSLVKFRQVQLCLLLAVAVLFAAPVILQAQSTDPQDVFAALDELEEKGVETWFGRGILDHAWAPVARLQDSLEDKHGLSIFGLYSPIVKNPIRGYDCSALSFEADQVLRAGCAAHGDNDCRKNAKYVAYHCFSHPCGVYASRVPFGADP